MKYIPTGGISGLTPLEGTDDLFFGTGAPHGDLYEAEELFWDGGSLKPDRLILVKYPSGQVTEPLKAAPGQYFGRPVYYDGGVYALLADFPAGEIQILKLDGPLENAHVHATFPLTEVEDCYNLSLKTAPLMLTRQADILEILWPERRRVRLQERETFRFRDGDELWMSRWNEEGEGDSYRCWEEIVVRNLDGDQLSCQPGDIQLIPNGEKWLLG